MVLGDTQKDTEDIIFEYLKEMPESTAAEISRGTGLELRKVDKTLIVMVYGEKLTYDQDRGKEIYSVASKRKKKVKEEPEELKVEEEAVEEKVSDEPKISVPKKERAVKLGRPEVTDGEMQDRILAVLFVHRDKGILKSKLWRKTRGLNAHFRKNIDVLVDVEKVQINEDNKYCFVSFRDKTTNIPYPLGFKTKEQIVQRIETLEYLKHVLGMKDIGREDFDLQRVNVMIDQLNWVIGDEIKNRDSEGDTE